jgi:hypothetical protein
VCVAVGAVVAVVLGVSAAGAQEGPAPGTKGLWIERADGICRKAEGRRVKVATPPSLVGAVAVVTHGRAPNAKQRQALKVYFAKIADIGQQELTALEGLTPPAIEKAAVLDLISEWEATQANLAHAVKLLKSKSASSAKAAKSLLAWGDSTAGARGASFAYGLLECGRVDEKRLVPISPTNSYCIDDPNGAQDEVSCDGPHDAEVFAELDEIAPPETPYPGEDGVSALADAQCGNEFTSFVGIGVEGSVLDYSTFIPNEEQWNSGDHSAECDIISRDGQQLTGSARGTRH